jgi:hypothetical protein
MDARKIYADSLNRSGQARETYDQILKQVNDAIYRHVSNRVYGFWHDPLGNNNFYLIGDQGLEDIQEREKWTESGIIFR